MVSAEFFDLIYEMSKWNFKIVEQSSQEEGSEMSEDDSFSKRDKQNETDNTIEEDQKREMKESKLSRSSNSSSLKAGNSDRDGKETLKNINKEKVNQSTKEAEELPKKLKGNEENKPKESQKIKPRVTGKRPSPNDEDVSLVETTREVQRSSHMPIEALPAKEELNSQQSNKRNKGTDIISAVSNIGINHKKDLPVSSNEMDIFKEEDTLFRSPMESALQMNDTDFSSETKSRQSSKKLTATQLVIVIRNITKHPIAKFCNFLIRSHSQGQCWAKANISHPSKMKIVLHEGEHASGVVNYLLELASFVACSSYLHEEETLLTHSFSTLVSIPVSVGVEIDLQVKVLQFADSMLSLEGLVFIGGDRSKVAVKCMMIKRIILEPNQSLVPSNVNSITMSSPSLTVPSSPAHTI